MRAREIMNPDVVTVPSGTNLAAATALMLEHGINALPVLNEAGRVVGMIGIRDVLRVPLASHDLMPILKWDSLEAKAAELTRTTVDRVMTRQRLVSVGEDTPAIEVAGLMANQGVHPILVLRDGELRGVIGRADVAALLLTLSARIAAPDERAGGEHEESATPAAVE